MIKSDLTQEYLKSILSYDPDTGVFTNLVNRRPKAKAGEEAGCVTSNGYRIIKIAGVINCAHRLVFLYMDGEFPPEQVDHINGNRSDNRRLNLRKVSNRENQRNKSAHPRNTSGFTGVFLHKSASKWVAAIKVDYKTIHLGFFTEKSDAIAARQAANIKYGFHPNHGKLAAHAK